MSAPMATVRELWRWPVKGMGGERLPSVRVDPRGTGGDRTHAVVRRAPDGTWVRLSERQEPRLTAWSAAYPFNLGANVDPANPPYAVVMGPDGRAFVWNDPRLLCALEDDLGHPVELRRDPAGLQHNERTLLVSWGSTSAAALRANLHLDGGDALADGLVLELDGGVRLRVIRPCPRGGVYARVLSGGRIAIGAAVQ